LRFFGKKYFELIKYFHDFNFLIKPHLILPEKEPLKNNGLKEIPENTAWALRLARLKSKTPEKDTGNCKFLKVIART